MLKVKIMGAYTAADLQQRFNKWASGKALTKDVIVHTLAVQQYNDREPILIIAVYYPEGSQFDTKT